MKDGIVWVLTLLFLGALAVLVIMNSQGFATAAGTVFTGFNSWAQTLSGAGYKNATYSNAQAQLL